MANKKSYKILWASLRKRFEAEDCKFITDEEKSQYPFWVGAIKVGRKNVPVQILVVQDELLITCRKKLIRMLLNGVKIPLLKRRKGIV